MSNTPRRVLRGLIAASAILIGSGVTAEARNGWTVTELVYMTADAGLSVGLSATDFFHDIGLAAAEQPELSLTEGDTSFLPVEESKRSGWRGVVDIEIERSPTLDDRNLTTFHDRLSQSVQERRMRGFYSMRYHFDTGLNIVPYAGAGLGVVAKGTDADVDGAVAGRATAGFDLFLAEETAVFAEYAFTKNGGVAFGNDPVDADNAVPDSEHSLKLGFRRTF